MRDRNAAVSPEGSPPVAPPHRRPELSFGLADTDEPDAPVERVGVRVRGDLDPSDPLALGESNEIRQECPADSSAHPIRIHEQVLELEHAGFEPPTGREAQDRAVDRHRDPGSAFGDRLLRRLDQLGMGDHQLAVALVRQRRTPE